MDTQVGEDQRVLSAAAMAKAGDHAAAARLLDQVLADRPGDARALQARGNAMFYLGRYEEAQRDFSAAASAAPGHHGLKNDLAVVLRKLGRNQEALQHYDAAIALRPDTAAYWCNRASLLIDLGRPTEALESADRAIVLQPGRSRAELSRGNALRDLMRNEDSLAAHTRALQLDPDSVDAMFGIAVALSRLGRYDEAIRTYDRILVRQPQYRQAHVNRSIDLLLTGRLPEGFRAHEWRYKAWLWPEQRWRGDMPIKGRSILLYCDDGLGDTIHFGRYATLLAQRGARVVLSPQAPLTDLMSTLDPRIRVLNLDLRRRTLKLDYHCPLLSLPLEFGTSLETIPATVPYLKAEPQRVEQWAARIGRHGFKIGVCWQGSTNKYDIGRSFDVSHFAGLAALPGVRLISLHKGAGESQLSKLPPGMRIEVLGEDFDSGPQAFLDTAAVMMNCDLVISSDTAVAHLAGALGVETWVALKRVPAWRWLLDRTDCPWYPTMTLFRQREDDDWRGVFEAIETALRERLSR